MLKIIYLCGSIDNFLAHSVIDEIHYTDSCQIIILNINSIGGSVLWMNKIIEAIKDFEGLVVGYVSGKAYSAAFRILQACHIKIVSSTASLMMHYPFPKNRELVGYGFSPVGFGYRRTIFEHNNFLRRLSKRTGLPLNTIIEFNHFEEIFDAQTSLEYNFTDYITE